MAWRVKIAVEIRTASALIWNVGPTIELPGTTLEIRDGLLVYPDRRAHSFQIFAWQDTDEANQDWEQSVYAIIPSGFTSGTLQAIQSESTNESYVLLPDSINVSTASRDSSTSLANVVVEERPEEMPGTVLYSEPFRPFALSATQALHVSLRADDELVRVASTTREMSTGQFGRYPVILFGRRTVWVVALSEEQVPVEVVPVSQLHGLIAEHGVAGVEGGVAFVAQDGIWLLTQGLEEQPISRPLHAPGSTGPFVLDPEASLDSVFIDEQPALVYSRAGTDAFIYWLAWGGWSTCDRRTQQVLEYDGRLLFYGTTAYNSQPSLRRWNPDVAAGDVDYIPTWRLRSAPIGGEVPEKWKRIWYLSLRQRLHSGGVTLSCLVDGTPIAGVLLDTTSDTTGLYVPAVQVFEVKAESFHLLQFGQPPVSAADTEVYGIDVIYEERYEHRPLVGKLS
jgi:hypothetical protein